VSILPVGCHVPKNTHIMTLVWVCGGSCVHPVTPHTEFSMRKALEKENSLFGKWCKMKGVTQYIKKSAHHFRPWDLTRSGHLKHYTTSFTSIYYVASQMQLLWLIRFEKKVLQFHDISGTHQHQHSQKKRYESCHWGGTFSKGTLLYLKGAYWYLNGTYLYNYGTSMHLLGTKVYLFEKVPPQQWQLLYLFFWEWMFQCCHMRFRLPLESIMWSSHVNISPYARI